MEILNYVSDSQYPLSVEDPISITEFKEEILAEQAISKELLISQGP